MFTGRSHTELAALGCVDAVQSNTLAVDLNRIAISDGGDAGEFLLCRRWTDCRKREQQTKHRCAPYPCHRPIREGSSISSASPVSLCTSSRMTFSVISDR